MSGAATAAWVGVGIAAAGAVASAYQNDRKMHQQKIANQKAEARAKETRARGGYFVVARTEQQPGPLGRIYVA